MSDDVVRLYGRPGHGATAELGERWYMVMDVRHVPAGSSRRNCPVLAYVWKHVDTGDLRLELLHRVPGELIAGMQRWAWRILPLTNAVAVCRDHATYALALREAELRSAVTDGCAHFLLHDD